MCLVFIGFQVDDRQPVLIGANREEFRSRPSTSPVSVRSGPLRCLLAGADQGHDGSAPQAGTWLGVNESGLVVAVTNRHDSDLTPDQQVRSRGWLAVALLGFDHPEPAARFARDELARGGYGGANFLIAHAQTAISVQAPGARRIVVETLPPGVHAMTNLMFNDPEDPRIRFVHDHLDPARFVASAAQICRDEHIVVTGADKGTISSSLIVVGRDIDLYHVEGDPSLGEYEKIRAFPRC